MKPTSNPHKFWEDANTTATSTPAPAPTPVAASTTTTTTATPASPSVSHAKTEDKPALTSSTGSSTSVLFPKSFPTNPFLGTLRSKNSQSGS